MSVKYRITLLVTAPGFIASLIFSLVVFFELLEQPFDVLDYELAEEANRAVKVTADNKTKSELESIKPHIFETFPTWLKIMILIQKECSGSQGWQSRSLFRL